MTHPASPHYLCHAPAPCESCGLPVLAAAVSRADPSTEPDIDLQLMSLGTDESDRSSSSPPRARWSTSSTGLGHATLGRKMTTAETAPPGVPPSPSSRGCRDPARVHVGTPFDDGTQDRLPSHHEKCRRTPNTPLRCWCVTPLWCIECGHISRVCCAVDSSVCGVCMVLGIGVAASMACRSPRRPSIRRFCHYHSCPRWLPRSSDKVSATIVRTTLQDHPGGFLPHRRRSCHRTASTFPRAQARRTTILRSSSQVRSKASREKQTNPLTCTRQNFIVGP